jgi:glycosyltransferase involved in cell wall biosynthesis
MANELPESELALVSIVVRSMGRTTLFEALNSIASQTHPKIEIVVVNALGVGHPALGERHGSRQLRYVNSGHPLARSAAANAGLDACTGDYIGFLDDDDLLLPSHVSELLSILQAPGAAWIGYSGVRMEVMDAKGNEVTRVDINLPFHLPSLRAQNYIPMHAVVFHRRLLALGCRMDEALDRYEDWDFWLQLAAHSPFLHNSSITAIYRNFGHSGFGLDPNKELIEQGRAALFEKWGRRWSGTELSEILSSLRDGIVHRPPAQVAHTEILTQTIERLEALHAKAQRDAELLAQEITDLRVKAHCAQDSVTALQQELEIREAEIRTLRSSTSWRVTAPLRALVKTLFFRGQ